MIAARLRALLDAAESYMQHGAGCIRGRLEGGEPTPGGGYRQKYAGVWYDDPSKIPPCDCGRDEAIAALHALAREQSPEREAFVEAADVTILAWSAYIGSDCANAEYRVFVAAMDKMAEASFAYHSAMIEKERNNA